MKTYLASGLLTLSLIGFVSASGLKASSQALVSQTPTPAVAPAQSPTAPVQPNPCETDPDSPACSTQQLLERILQERQERQEQAVGQMLEEFPERFGYNPKDYELDLRLEGNTVTIFGKSDWANFHVTPEEGLIEVGHRSATVDAFFGTLVWHDHDMVSTTFTLDEEACQAIANGVNCEFIGVDQIKLNQSFITNHQLIKHGKWQITYIESDQEKSIGFRVPEDALPKGAEDANLSDMNRRLCRLLPHSLDCQ